jgi:Bacterial Ig-like domain
VVKVASGVITFAKDAAGTFFMTDPAFPVAATSPPLPGFAQLLPATNTKVGPFLQDLNGLHTDPASGNVYIGLGPLTPITVTGSPLGKNAVTVTGPDAGGIGVTTITSNLFALSGKVSQVFATPGTNIYPVQKPGAVSAVQTFTLQNLAPDIPLAPVPPISPTVILGTVVISGNNPADFTVTADTCSGATLAAVTPLAAGGKCTFNVTFSEPAPGVNGPKSAVIAFPITSPLNQPVVFVNVVGAIDSIPPTVVATTPADKAVNVPANNAIIATFSEPVTGVGINTFTLSTAATAAAAGTAVTGTVNFDAASNTATFTPSANLPVNAVNTATIVGGAAGITDVVGNPLAQNVTFSFTTTSADTTPPQVISNLPAIDAVHVGISKAITVTFNEPVLPFTVNATTFTLSGAVTGAVTYDPQKRTATFTPDRPLAYHQKYTVTVAAGVKSLGKIPMAADFTWSFTTNGAPTAPKLFAPLNTRTDIDTSVDLQWIKSTDPDNDKLTYHVYLCTDALLGCPPVDVTFSNNSTVSARSVSSRSASPAGAGRFGTAGFFLAGFAIVGGVKSRKKVFYMIAVLLLSGMAFTACGSKSSKSAAQAPPAGLLTKSVAGLQAATKYYWKVVADDGNGVTAESEIWSFTTK